MSGILRAIQCPDCRDRADSHLFCETCLGSRRITIGPRKVPLDKRKLLRWGIFCFVVGTVILLVLVNL